MKGPRSLLIIIFICCLLLLTSCGQNELGGETTDWTPLQIARAVLESQPELPSMTAILAGDELYDAYVDSHYRFDPGDIADGAILCANTVSAQEIAVLRLAEDANIDQAEQIFSDYSQRRLGAFDGYLPDEAALIEDASIVAQGDMIALLICREPELAEDAFRRAFTEDPPDDTDDVSHSVGSGASVSGSKESAVIPQEPENDMSPVKESEPEIIPTYTVEPAQTDAPLETATPPQPIQAEDIPWTYNSARLLDAWRSGDWSGLTQRDQEILNVCREVIGWPGFDALTDYEKELAVHDWMLANGRYDTNRLSNLPEYQENPDNDNPYGFLIGGVGICRGYTTTFQLFMDLIGIECISVQGQANSTRGEHAWNMVRLEGEWYCVDVTWDDPTTDQPVTVQKAHRYFNVTSEFMRVTAHYWDDSSVPEASGTKLVWNNDGSSISE